MLARSKRDAMILSTTLLSSILLLQRRKRQQALSSGGIRASDAASLRRGLVLGQSAGTSKPEPRVSLDGDIASGRGGQPSDNAKDSSDHRGDAVGEEGRHSFSTAVKQFSAPRQVHEGDPGPNSVLWCLLVV